MTMRSAVGAPLLFAFFITATTNHVITTLNAFSLGPLAAVQHIVGRSTLAKNFVTQSYSFVSLSATSRRTDEEDDSDSNNDPDKDNERSNKKNRKKKDESKHKSHDDVKKKHEKEEVKSDQDDMNDNSDEKMKQVLEVAAAYTNSEELPTLPKQQQDDSAYNVVQKKLMFIQSLGAITSRGEHASKEQRLAAQQVVSELEEIQSSNDKSRGDDEAAPSLLGRWELVFCDCGQLFRSSPFFMAGRAVCQTEQQAAQYDWFCDMHRKALAISNIGPVRQIITPTRLVSEFEVVVGAIPFLNDIVPFLSYSGGMPVTITGAIVSTADWTKPTTRTETASSSNNDMELYMDTVEIKGSNMPLLRQVLDTGNVRLKSRDLANALEQAVPSMYTTPRPIFRTTYLGELFRIGRDQDDNIFGYVKTSDSTDLTDYSTVDADLRVARLLEGFNDAVTRLYL